jgi:hypothetical protein
LTGAAHTILERRELFDANWAARVQASGCYPDLCSEAEFTAVSELRGGIMQHDGRIDPLQKFLSGAAVSCYDGVGVMGAIAFYMVDGLVDPVDQLHRDDCVEIFGAPVFVGRALYAHIGSLGTSVAPHLASGVNEHAQQWHEQGWGGAPVDE